MVQTESSSFVYFSFHRNSIEYCPVQYSKLYFMEVILKRQIKASTKGNKAAQHGGVGDVGVSVAGPSRVPVPGPGEGSPPPGSLACQ
ncbi:hypothetical protein NPIL_298741 [Nephila pilipes]|uniref:Uncharacterized protein n=1 Tax=Nephila pilipes TaxID=299642 RepID=A0A8X6QEB9_NEPPI|nr:hypothetical protein NPIL_298741 [Nephila pilipes]